MFRKSGQTTFTNFVLYGVGIDGISEQATISNNGLGGIMWNGSVKAQQQADEAFKLARKRHQEKERFKTQSKKPKRVDYYAYIRSAKWKKFRDKVFKFRGHKCEDCGANQHLELHHISYARLGRERFKDVKILCHNCHSTTHEDKGAFSDLAQEFFAITQ